MTSKAALPALLLLAVAGCATRPEVSYGETVAAAEAAAANVQATGTQEGWEAGQRAYLDWSGARHGWTTTESGLQYRRDGRAVPGGAQPTATDTVRVHYRGTFIDGREFDSSYSRGQPAEFPLNRVIRGWTEGVALMREGETFDFVIPADLAYGARWVGGEIPPNSALRFRVELIDVNPAD